MQKICVNKEDNLINQIFDLADYPEFKPEHYPYCYVIDDENNEITHYGYRYNLELEKFELIEGYEEVETLIEPDRVEALQEKTTALEIELAVTQSALDFLLMGVYSAATLQEDTNRGGTNFMAGYLAMRIIKGMLSYKEVVTRYPEFKEEIDFILKAEGKHDLIIQL